MDDKEGTSAMAMLTRPTIDAADKNDIGKDAD